MHADRAPRDRTVDRLVEWLDRHPGCSMGDGLSPAEIDAAERVLDIAIPPLWREVLRTVAPVPLVHGGPHCPGLGEPESPATRRWVESPVHGLLFDVEHNDFWWRAWGPRPDDASDRLAAARERLAEVPRLTPLVGHLYVAGHDDSPVFSIVQADLHVPATTLAGLTTGAGQDSVDIDRWPIGDVPFWSELHAYGQIGHTVPRIGALGQGGL